MNYIAQLNGFWAKFLALPDAKQYHGFLYMALLEINNRTGWQKTFDVSLAHILNLTKINKNTYYSACDFLNANGFFTFYQKGRNQYENAKFGLRVLSQNQESIGNAQGIQRESIGNIYCQCLK